MLAHSLLIGSPTEIGLSLAVSVAMPCLKTGVTKEVFQDWGTCPVLKAALNNTARQGASR